MFRSIGVNAEMESPKAFLDELEPWIRFYSYGLTTIFVVGLATLAGGTFGATRRLRAAARALAELSPADPLNGATERTHRALLAVVENLVDRGGMWWAVVQPTITQYARHDTAKGVHTGYYVTERIDDNVSIAPAAGEALRAFAHITPGVLTSLGLIGTFVALLLGLRELEPGPNGTWNITPLIDNLSGKFVTSIVALALSVVFVLFEQATRPVIGRAKAQLARALSNVLPLLSTSHLLLDLQQQSIKRATSLNELRDVANSQAQALAALTSFSEQQLLVSRALHDASERQVTQLERFNTDIAVAIGSAMDARIVPALDRLLEGLSELKKVQAGFGEELLKEVARKLSGAVSGAAGKEMESMAVAIKEGARTLNDAAQAMRDGQARLVDVTATVLDQMNQSFDGRAKRLSEETEHAVKRLVQQLEGAAGGFSTKIGGASQDVSTALVATSASLERVADACRETVLNTDVTLQRFEGLVVKVSAATQDMAGAHAALKGTAVPLQQVAERTAAVVGSIERQVGLMGSAATSLEATSTTLNAMQNTLQSSWAAYEDRFAGVDTSLGQALDGMKGGFELYAEKIRELNAALDKHFSKALADLSAAVYELHESVQDLQAVSPPKPPQGQARR